MNGEVIDLNIVIKCNDIINGIVEYIITYTLSEDLSDDEIENLTLYLEDSFDEWKHYNVPNGYWQYHLIEK